MQIDDSKLFPPEPSPTGSRRPSDRPATRADHRVVITTLTVLAMIGGGMAGAEPTGWRVADVVFAAGLAGVVTLAGSRARRSTWLWVSGVATISAPDLTLAAVGLAATSVALAAQLLNRRSRVEGALVAAVSVQVLLRLGDVAFFGASALLLALAVGPLLVSAYQVAPRRVRRRVHLAGAVVGGFLALGIVVFLVATALASSDVDEGTNLARDGLSAARDGDDGKAATDLAASSAALQRSNDILGSWWTRPARAVPFIGHQLRAAEVATAEGSQLAGVAADAASSVPIEDLEFDDGRLDLDLVRAAQEPLEATATALAEADARLAEVDTTWVVDPFDARLGQLREEIATAGPDARLAAEVAAIAPGLLGGDGTRRYFVIFTTPAETRGLGGFMGNWAELTADNGKVTVTRSGRTQELRDASPAASRSISAVVDGEQDQRIVDYLYRYDTQNPADALQDITMSPDLPTVAEVIRQLYPQTGGDDLDGVLVVDPYALEALMAFTGPIQLDGLERPLRPRNAADFLLVDQYQLEDQEERADLLDEASRAVFDKLTTGDLPNPRKVADVLYPVTRQGRLGITSFHADEQELFHRLGLDAAMPEPGGVDAFSVVTANGAQNKIDVYLERTVTYATTVDPGTGALAATATVELVNDVPSLDLPLAVIGSNDQGLPLGTNEVLFSFYSPHRLTEARVDGQPAGFGVDRELGFWVYSTRVVLPAGGRAVVEVDLEGQVAPFDTYEVTYIPQPIVRADDVSVETSIAPAATGWTFAGEGDFLIGADGTTAVATPVAGADAVLRIGVTSTGGD